MENKNISNIKNEEQVAKLLKLLGISPNLKGYHYIKVAIDMLQNDPTLIHRVTKELYPGIAEKCNSTVAKVERAIRHAVEVSFSSLCIDDIREYFGNCVRYNKDKLTNSEFLSIVAERLEFERAKENGKE